MARPKPTVVLEKFDKKTHCSDQVLEADAIWAVFYQGRPFNLKNINHLGSYSGSKYKKVSFSNPGHAHNLAKKLNILFGSVDFQVVKFTQGETV